MMTFPQMQHQFGEVKSGEVQTHYNPLWHMNIYIYCFRYNVYYYYIYIYVYRNEVNHDIFLSPMAQIRPTRCPEIRAGNPPISKWMRSCEILRKPLENIGQILEIPYKWKN